MLTSEMDLVDQIARRIAKEEIAKAIAALQVPVAEAPVAPETETEEPAAKSLYDKP
jgi:hypothetical protein